MQEPNNPQAPQGGNQVPDHRLQELTERMRELEQQNSMLRGQINTMAQQSGQKPPQQKESPFKPEVEQAIRGIFQEMVEPVQQQVKQSLGYLVDKTDEVGFLTQYGSEKFKPYHEKVERLREQYQARGQYIPREEALRMVYFQETGVKSPAPEQKPPEPEKKEPKWDQYLGTYVDPETGSPVDPRAQQIENQFQEPQTPQTQQTQQTQGMPWQQQQQQVQKPEPVAGVTPPGTAPQQTHPYENPFGAPPKLPSQGLNHPAPPQRTQTSQIGPIDLDASDDQLKAFEAKYGDVSF